LHLIIPIIDRVGYKLSMLEQVMDAPSQEVITKDDAMVQVDGVVFFEIIEASQAAYEVNNLQNAITN